MSAAIETAGLVRRFDEVEAVAGVDLLVGEGEIFGFLGPNGAGKSTTVKMLITLLAPTGGTARVLGHDLVHESDAIRLRIGAALQDVSLDPKLTGRETLLLQARYYGMGKTDTARRMEEVLALVDIGDAIDRRAGTYSGGMKRRLDLAAALIHRPELLFLDEPTTGLDPTSRALVWEEVRRLNREQGMTIFLTTQYLEEADELADRVGIIAEGRIVAEGTPTELKRAIGADVIVARVEGDGEEAAAVVRGLAGIESVHVQHDTLTISATQGDALLSPVAVALHGCGVKVRGITLRTPTLDDVFFEATGAHIQLGGDQ
jgi:ABC-2 type transport system ATP-binding protein